MLAAGEIGTVDAVMADHGQVFPRDPQHRLRRADLGGGVLLDLGSYPIQLDSLALGAPRSVRAMGLVDHTGFDTHATLLLDHGTQDLSVLTTTIETQTPTTAAIGGAEARIILAGPFHTAQGFTVLSSQWGVEPRTWSDQTNVSFFDGMSWQVNAFAAFAGERRVESPSHSHEETVSIIATIGARRQLTHAPTQHDA